MGILINMKAAISLAAVSMVAAVNIERDPLLTWAPSTPASGYPKNYFVPHFGEDSTSSPRRKTLPMLKLNTATFWIPLHHPPPRNYFVPHFGTDVDIKSSLKNLADEEKIHGAWNYPA